tara:strand:- start:10629 stop:11783 length:1155 start_codon:yes stop_codon:yes gene_type:complete
MYRINKHAFFGTMVLALFVGCTSGKTDKADQTRIQVTELNTYKDYVDSDKVLLGMPVRLKYDGNDQHLFIQDLPKWGITEVDDSSTVVHQYGQRGRGPGEIQMLNDFFFNDNHLFIIDGGQYFVHKYSREDGKHISSLDYAELRTKRKTVPDGPPPPPMPLNDNNNQPFVTLNETVLIPSHFGEAYLYKAVNWQGEKIADIAAIPESCTISEDEDAARSALKNKEVPAKDQCLAFPVNDRANPDEIYIIYSAIPKIEKYDLSGEKLWEREIPDTPEVDTLAIDLATVAKEHPDRRLSAMNVRKYVAGRSNEDGELLLMTYTNLVTRFAPRRPLWIHKFDAEGELVERMKLGSGEDLNPYVGMDFERERILVSPHMGAEVREYEY